MKRGMVNSMRIMISTSNLKRSAVEVLGGLAAFRPVPSVHKWVLCLLLLQDGDSSVGDGSKVCVCYIKSVGSLDGGGGELSGSGGFLDK